MTGHCRSNSSACFFEVTVLFSSSNLHVYHFSCYHPDNNPPFPKKHPPFSDDNRPFSLVKSTFSSCESLRFGIPTNSNPHICHHFPGSLPRLYRWFLGCRMLSRGGERFKFNGTQRYPAPKFKLSHDAPPVPSSGVRSFAAFVAASNNLLLLWSPSLGSTWLSWGEVWEAKL